jgi:hypothetical protein
MRNYLTTAFYGVMNPEKFIGGIQQAIDQVATEGVFAGDNLFTYQRNLSFLDDAEFMAAFSKNAITDVERSVIWRTHVLCWAARNGLRLEGDFLECACYKGTSARIVCDYLDFGNSGKRYYLYDLFEHSDEMDHHGMPEHGADLYGKVKQRFADLENVLVTQGSVPEILYQVAPEKIAFLHLDINSAAAEIGALEFLFDRITPGGIIVLDDYGWRAYRPQKEAEDVFFAARGYHVLELPTGQGLVIK